MLLDSQVVGQSSCWAVKLLVSQAGTASIRQRGEDGPPFHYRSLKLVTQAGEVGGERKAGNSTGKGDSKSRPTGLQQTPLLYFWSWQTHIRAFVTAVKRMDLHPGLGNTILLRSLICPDQWSAGQART